MTTRSIDTFRTNYKLAKECLEMHAGFGKPSTEARKNRARKLCVRAGKFAGLHAEVLGEFSRHVEDSVRRLEVARDVGDSAQSRKRQSTLVGSRRGGTRIYNEPRADSAATERFAAAPSDIEAHGPAATVATTCRYRCVSGHVYLRFATPSRVVDA